MLAQVIEELSESTRSEDKTLGAFDSQRNDFDACNVMQLKCDVLLEKNFNKLWVKNPQQFDSFWRRLRNRRIFTCFDCNRSGHAQHYCTANTNWQRHFVSHSWCPCLVETLIRELKQARKRERHMLKSSTQLQNRSFHVVERTRTFVQNVKKWKMHTCKACKNTVFHCQICKFVEFLLPLSSWSLKLLYIDPCWRRVVKLEHTSKVCQPVVVVLMNLPQFSVPSHNWSFRWP